MIYGLIIYLYIDDVCTWPECMCIDIVLPDSSACPVDKKSIHCMSKFISEYKETRTDKRYRENAHCKNMFEIFQEFHTIYHITYSHSMQKIALAKIIREEIIRAFTFALTLFVLLFAGFGTLAYAADGGAFGTILNKILVKAWDDPTNNGTVKNCEKLANIPATGYVKIPSGGISCGNNKCIEGIDASGVPRCTP